MHELRYIQIRKNPQVWTKIKRFKVMSFCRGWKVKIMSNLYYCASKYIDKENEKKIKNYHVPL